MSERILEARALTEPALLDIFRVLQEATTPEEFFANVDTIIANPENQLPWPISLGVPDSLTVSGTRGVDIQNAPRVHQYVGELDRANASDARLWSYLAFATYRDYMEKRWRLESDDANPESWKRRVRDRWLLHSDSVTRGRLVRHGIARLWWVSHLTYCGVDAEGVANEDPYAYTTEVFKREDRLNAIFDREVGAIPSVMRAVLDHASSLGDAATDKYIHRIMQYLTLVNGYRDIGVLDFSTVQELIRVASSRALRR